jgi:hypothetical protein
MSSHVSGLAGGLIVVLGALALGGTVGGCSASRGGTANLSWTPPTRNTDGSPADKIAGYYIYFGTSPDSLNNTIRIDGGQKTSYVFHHLSPGVYYFSVAAFETPDQPGPPAAPVSETIKNER